MWFSIQDQEVKIRIFAKPHGSKTAFLGIGEQGLQISIHAIPHKGEANKELISFLAKLFGLPKKQVVLLRGGNSKYKQITLPLTNKVKEFLEEPSRFINIPTKKSPPIE
ncbi:MAG: DUF167 domain-containing protein [Gammaproteobacteria bacterium]